VFHKTLLIISLTEDVTDLKGKGKGLPVTYHADTEGEYMYYSFNYS